MKRFIKFISLITVCIIVASIFSVCVSAETTDLVFSGPDYCKQGNDIELSIVAQSAGLYGVSGILTYDPLYVSFQEISSDISGWSVDYNEESGKILFACSDEKANNPTKQKNSILTVVFKLNGYPQDDKVSIFGSELKASDGKGILEAADIKFTLSSKFVENKTPINNDEYETIYGEATIADEDNNFLKSLEIKNVKYTPEFTPENKLYEATVPFDVESVEVVAVPQYEGSSVTIDGTELTYIGRNIVKIVVLSESGLKRTYKVYVERKAPNNKNAINSKEKLPMVAIIVISLGVLLILALALFFIIFNIRRKKKRVS